MSSESDPCSHILHAVRLLIQRAPAADAADDVVETWGGYVVQLLDGLNERQPEFLSLPEVISLMNILQNRVDVRQRVAWLAWGGDWLPGTMIKQCLSRLPAAPAANNSASPLPPPPTEMSLPVTAEKTKLELEESSECDFGPAFELELEESVERDRPLDMGFGPLDSSGASTSISTASTKRTTALNEASSPQERPTKRSRYADDTTIVKSESDMTIVGLRLGEPIKDEENLDTPLSWPVAPSYTDKEIQASSSGYWVSSGIACSSLDLPESDLLASASTGNVRAIIKDASISILKLTQLIVGPSEESPQDASVTDHERPTLDLDLFVHPMVKKGWAHVHVRTAATQLPKPARSYRAALHITRNDQ